VDATRYAVDDFLDKSADQEDANSAIVTLARYFSARPELAAFATHLIEVIRDDQRLQVSARLDRLLNARGAMEGASTSIARLLSSVRHVSEAECQQLSTPP
jgi:hypothetical protein